ncbi:MAG: hypothetical protein WAO71_07445 [Gallionella sp.]
MKKLSVLAFALIMSVSSNVFAGPSIGVDTTVDGVKYTRGSEGVSSHSGHHFDRAVNVNGKTYPSGTKFDVIKMHDGKFVPTHANGVAIQPAAAGGAATGGATAGATTGGTVGGLSTTTALVGAGVAGAAAVIAGNTTTTHHP